jgi:hypothetical protein
MKKILVVVLFCIASSIGFARSKNPTITIETSLSVLDNYNMPLYYQLIYVPTKPNSLCKPDPNKCTLESMLTVRLDNSGHYSYNFINSNTSDEIKSVVNYTLGQLVNTNPALSGTDRSCDPIMHKRTSKNVTVTLTSRKNSIGIDVVHCKVKQK